MSERVRMLEAWSRTRFVQIRHASPMICVRSIADARETRLAKCWFLQLTGYDGEQQKFHTRVLLVCYVIST